MLALPTPEFEPQTMQNGAPKRAQSLAELDQLTKLLFSTEGVKQGLAMSLRPSDVVITPFGKSGTTWTQQIVHTLRTRGDMAFDDISRVVPWIETSTDLGLDLNAEQRANPRAFKSHLTYDVIPKGGRYINVMRDPADAAVSMFKFEEGWFLEPGAVSLDEYVQQEYLKHPRYFAHLKSWWPQRHADNVLFLCYEDMLGDAEQTIRRIAAFIGIELDQALLDLTLTHSSIEFMLQHKDRFDDAMLRARSEHVCNLPKGSDSAKVRKGKSGDGVSLSAESQQKLQDVWQREITDTLGFANYAAMRTALAS